MILLTGATGFLGRNLVPRLVKNGRSLRALVRPSSDVQFLQALGVELAYADDISDAAAVQDACAGCSHVIHAAGQFRFWGDLDSFRQTNVAGTEAVVKAAVFHNVDKFIHISTIAVVGTTPVNGIIDETTPCQPKEPYQISKYEAEQVVRQAIVDHQLPAIILRPGAFYGPWGRYAFNRLFFEEPLRGWRIKVDGGKHITFPVFVDDVAQAAELALTNGGLGETYNICGNSYTHNEVNQIISDLANLSRFRFDIPSPLVLALASVWTAVSRFTGQEPFYPINMAPYVFQDWPVANDKAQRELGFQPTPFEQGAAETLNWYWEQGILRRKL